MLGRNGARNVVLTGPPNGVIAGACWPEAVAAWQLPTVSRQDRIWGSSWTLAKHPTENSHGRVCRWLTGSAHLEASPWSRQRCIRRIARQALPPALGHLAEGARDKALTTTVEYARRSVSPKTEKICVGPCNTGTCPHFRAMQWLGQVDHDAERPSTATPIPRTEPIPRFTSDHTGWCSGHSMLRIAAYPRMFVMRALGSCSREPLTPICTFAAHPGLAIAIPRRTSLYGRYSI
jgi:hypothetical protein